MGQGLACGGLGPRQIRCESMPGQGAAYVALPPQEALPEPVHGRDAEVHIPLAQSVSLVAQVNDEFQESPQGAGAQAQAFEFIGRPDAERMAAAVLTDLAIVAEDPPAAPSAQAAVLAVSIQVAVQDQSSGGFTMRTRREFQAMVETQEIILAAKKSRECEMQSRPSRCKAGGSLAAAIVLATPAHSGGRCGQKSSAGSTAAGLHRGLIREIPELAGYKDCSLRAGTR